MVNTLAANDVITDETKTDSDTLNVSINAANVKATIKNIENVNVTWTSNADLALDATNMTGNTFNLNASGLAFTGAATIAAVGTNNVNAGTKVTASLTLADILDSKIDAGAAKVVTIDQAAAVPVVGQKTAAAVTVNGNTAIVNKAADQVQNLTINATAAATVSLGDTAGVGGAAPTGAGIGDKLTVTGSKDVTVKGVVTGEEIVNSLTDGAKLTVTSTDAAGLNTAKINANLINLAGAAGAVTVKDGQSFAVVGTGSLTSLVANTGLTNVTTNLSTAGNIAALDVTGISNLNLEVTKLATIGLTTAAANNVKITGAGDLTLTSTGVAAIDASALTGKFDYTASSTLTTGVIGSATAANTIKFVSDTGQTVTAIGGAAADTFNVTAASAGNVNIKAGAGNDTIKVDGALTGTASIDGGEGTDTLSITVATGVTAADASSKVTLSGIEKILAVTNTNFNNVQLSGQTYEIAATAGNGNLNVSVYDATGAATAATTDLSGLVLSTATGANIATVAIKGFAGVDTIKATKANDTITAGTGADIIDISQGGADVLVLAKDDSTWSTSSNKMDKVTGFNAVATGAGNVADKIDFAGTSTVAVATDAALVTAGGLDVKAAITGGTGTEAVKAIVANGVVTLSGIDSTKIDTLVEWVNVAKLALNEGTAAAIGETIAFAFGGDTYVLNVSAASAATFDIVQLVGVTGVTAVSDTAAAANTIWVA